MVRQEYIDNVPGSLYLVEGGPAAHHEAGFVHSDKQKEIILDPTPSRDVNDPLNWTPRRKLLAATCAFVYTGGYGFTGTTIYSLLVGINHDTGIPVATLVQGTGYLFGLLGWAGPFVLPLAFRYGNRPIFLLSMLSQIAISVWTPRITTVSMWLFSRCLAGICGPPVETLVEIALAQVFFTHERGYYIGIYAFLVFGSNYLAPALSGFVFDGIGWHWTMYWTAFVAVGSAIFLFFFQEETNYNRPPEEVLHEEVLAFEREKEHPAEKTGSKNSDVDVAIVTAADLSLQGTPTPYIKKLKLYNGTFMTWKGVFTCMWRPWYLIFRFPCIFYAGFEYGCSLVAYNILNATLSPILTSPPYNFTTAISGCMYWAPLIGVVIGGIIAGYGGDKYAIWAAKRNGGVREPEQRLMILSLSMIAVPSGMILWGVGAAHNIHWFGLAVGIGLIGFSNGISATTTLGYALDCYRELGVEVMIAVIVIRNTLSFAIGYGITPWLDGLGQQNTFISAGFILMGILLLTFPQMYFGRRLRAASADHYWKLAETNFFTGH